MSITLTNKTNMSSGSSPNRPPPASARIPPLSPPSSGAIDMNRVHDLAYLNLLVANMDPQKNLQVQLQATTKTPSSSSQSASPPPPSSSS